MFPEFAKAVSLQLRPFLPGLHGTATVRERPEQWTPLPAPRDSAARLAAGRPTRDNSGECCDENATLGPLPNGRGSVWVAASLLCGAGDSPANGRAKLAACRCVERNRAPANRLPRNNRETASLAFISPRKTLPVREVDRRSVRSRHRT
jgi:hypothetical protein